MLSARDLPNTIACIALAVTTVGCGAKQAPPSEAPEPDSKTGEDSKGEDGIPSDLVSVYLLSDVTAISPGQEFRLAVRFDVAPTWHIYWTNPGEAGLPTSIDFDLPAGFVASETVYPGPKSFDGGDGITSYGYEELVMLSATVTAPDPLPQAIENGSFKVKASWLACREMCIPGNAESSMSVNVASAETPSAPANARLFAAHDKSLPIPLDAEAAELAWNNDQHALEITLPGATSAEYFPSLAEQVKLAGQLAVPIDGGVKLVLSYKKQPNESALARGVVRRTDDAGNSYHQLSWELPQ